MTPSNLSEKDIENKILQYLYTLPGAMAWKHSQTTASLKRRRSKWEPNGIPDIIGCYRGRMIAIEVKRPKDGVVSQAQKIFIEALNKHGALAFVATSVADVQRYFEMEEIFVPTLH